MSQLLLPFMLMHIFVFYIIFESICNVFAEVTFFADRQFYEVFFFPSGNADSGAGLVEQRDL